MFKPVKLLLLFLAPLFVQGQHFTWSDNCLKSYSEALKLNFNTVQILAQTERKVNSGNLLIPYTESITDFTRCFISESKADLETLKKRNAARINLLNASKVKSPYTKMLAAEYNIQIAVARLKFEEYLGAVYEIRKAFKLLEENKRLYPDFKPNDKGLGFIHVVVGGAPKNYQWILNLLGFSGTVNQGMKELRDLLDASYKHKELSWLREEVIVMLTFFEMNLIRDKDDANIRKRLNSIPDLEEKPLMLFATCVYHFANSENDSIIKLLGNRKANEEFHLHYLDYMEGMARLNNMDFSAESCFKKYISGFKGMTFIKSTYQRLAWCRLLQGDEAGYNLYINLAGEKGEGTVFSDEDKQALKEFKDHIKPNVILLKSRLYFDGGYYQRAISEIAGKPVADFPTLRDKLEFTYRLARIFDKTGKKEKAITYYQQTIDNGKNFHFYFAANSALQMGILYEERSDKVNAEKYYKMCLDMRDHEYQNSLDQKAKAGLIRLTEK